MAALAAYAAVGLLAGFAAGLLGIGGGVVIVPGLVFVFARLGYADGVVMHLAIGTSLATIVPTSISSAFTHRRLGHVALKEVGWLLALGIPAAWVGAELAAAVSGDILQKLFGLMLIAAGVRLFLSPEASRSGRAEYPMRGALLAIGAAAGLWSAFFGVGGGIIAVPLMTLVLGMPIHRAIGNSATMIVLLAAVGTVGHIVNGWSVAERPESALGFVEWTALVAVAPAAILAAPLGARSASALPAVRLQKIFAVLLLIVAARFIFG